jgi:hypothetical protein
MSTRIPLSRRPKAEDVEALFRCTPRPTVSAEPIPNPWPKPGGASRGKVDPDHWGAGPNWRNLGRTGGVGRAVAGGGVRLHAEARARIHADRAVHASPWCPGECVRCLNKEILKDRSGPKRNIHGLPEHVVFVLLQDLSVPRKLVSNVPRNSLKREPPTSVTFGVIAGCATRGSDIVVSGTAAVSKCQKHKTQL